MTQDNNWDVIVIGGGPGGSATATLIAMDGHKVLLLEKETFPRYHIGESLLPATIHGICALLGVKEEVEAAGFLQKFGGTLRWGKRDDLWSFWFKDQNNLFPDRPDYAYQVERSKFDHILLNNARKKGVDVREGCRVSEVLFEGERASGVKAIDSENREFTAHARYIVDASGLQGLLASKIGNREYDKFFRNMALFGYYKNGKRFPEPVRRGNSISAAFNEGWFWYIPLTDELTSVGVVVPLEHAGKISEMGMEAAFDYYVSKCPIIKEFLEPGERITEGEYGKLRVLRDFSYLNSHFWAPGAVLVGDTACFIDPVFSSGVHLATYGALLAARSINTCLRGELDEEACFAEFEMRYRREYGVFYEFLLGFYEMHHDEDSYFWQARKVLNVESNSGKEAFVQLVAGLSSSGEPLFQDADSFISSAKSQAQRLEQLSNAADRSKLPQQTREEVQAWGKIFFRERLQMWRSFQSTTREGRESKELPIFEGGLVPSNTGLHWARTA